MAAREKMLEYRVNTGVSVRRIARRLGISVGLLDMVENGDVTHPNIALRMQKLYGLTDEETEELMPENYRKSSPKYDPDKYKLSEPNGFTIDPSSRVYAEHPYYTQLTEHETRERVGVNGDILE